MNEQEKWFTSLVTTQQLTSFQSKLIHTLDIATNSNENRIDK